MARVYRTKRRAPSYRRKRRVYRRRSGYRRSYVPKTLSLTKVGVGLPSQLYMKHHYRADAINLTTASAGWVQAQFKLNSLYDPEVAAGGGQPTLRDNLYAMYHYARVVSCKVTAYFYNTGGMHLRCGVAYTADATDQTFNISAVNDLMSLPKDRVRWATLSEYGGSKTLAKVTKTYNIKHFESDLFSSVNFRALSTADPNKLLYVNVGCQNLTGGVDTACRAEVLLEYTVRWEDPINPEMAQED